MPSLIENRTVWAERYDWAQRGDEWSSAWGSVRMQWLRTVLPRIQAFVPAGTILEIAPGFGRWTQFLKGLCDRLILVDLSEKCIEACRRRFADDTHLTYHVNDGRSLAFIEDASIDFAFSFDSLVHAADDVVEAYVEQIGRKLTAAGVAFIHHSNLGEYATYASRVAKLPSRARGLLHRWGVIELLGEHWRDPTMTAAVFDRAVRRAGLRCLSQEIIPWHSRRLIDCITVFGRGDTSWPPQPRVVRNPLFMREAECSTRLVRLYTPSAPGPHGS